MNILDKVKLAFKGYGFVTNSIKEAQMPTGTGKPGWKSSEFWLNIAAQLGLLWGAVQHFVPPEYAAVISIGGVAVYTVARTIAKAVSDIQAAKLASTTVTTTAPVTTVSTPAVS